MPIKIKKLFAGLLARDDSTDRVELILPIEEQLLCWRKANRRMGWGIQDVEFDEIAIDPEWSDRDRADGFVGSILCYGFGSSHNGTSDAVLSGRLAWEYALKGRRGKTWRCEYVDFERTEDIRLRPGAPHRPRGFYLAKLQPGEKFKTMTVTQALKRMEAETGCGPEGFQFLCVTHPHAADLMSQRKLSFMALADYDVAPHGFNDFYDAIQLFCSNDILGLGIGNVDRNYPLFGIPTLRFYGKAL